MVHYMNKKCNCLLFLKFEVTFHCSPVWQLFVDIFRRFVDFNDARRNDVLQFGAVLSVERSVKEISGLENSAKQHGSAFLVEHHARTVHHAFVKLAFVTFDPRNIEENAS